MRGGKGALWTTKEEETLRKLFKEDLPIVNIAERMNRSVIAIQTRLARLHLTANQKKRKIAEDRFIMTDEKINKNQYKWTDEHIEKLRILWKSNLSVKSISLKFNRSPAAIRRAAVLYLGPDSERNTAFIKHAPKVTRITKSRLESWDNIHAKEHDAWLKMISAVTTEEKESARKIWEMLQWQETLILCKITDAQ